MLQMVSIPLDDYKRLLEAAEVDERLVWCETCGAWLDRDDPACASTDDYTGCWKVAAGEEATESNCRSYRAVLNQTPEIVGA